MIKRKQKTIQWTYATYQPKHYKKNFKTAIANMVSYIEYITEDIKNAKKS